MTNTVSARSSIGLAIVDQSDHVIGTVETWLIDARTRVVEGLLIGQTDRKAQGFIPLLCVDDIAPGVVRIIHYPVGSPPKGQRIIGLSAWTTSPKFLVGFVHDCLFDQKTGAIATFVIHQLVRTWHVPAVSVTEITKKALLIDTDTTIKLELAPYPKTVAPHGLVP